MSDYDLDESVNPRVWGRINEHSWTENMDLGLKAFNSKKFVEAERKYQFALQIAKVMYGPSSSQFTETLLSLEKCYVTDLAMDEEKYGPCHIWITDALLRLGEHQMAQMNWREAESTFTRAWAIFKDSNVDNGAVMWGLARAYEEQGKLELAEEMFRRNLEIAKRGGDHGGYRGAVSILRRIEAIYAKKHGIPEGPISFHSQRTQDSGANYPKGDVSPVQVDKPQRPRDTVSKLLPDLKMNRRVAEEVLGWTLLTPEQAVDAPSFATAVLKPDGQIEIWNRDGRVEYVFSPSVDSTQALAVFHTFDRQKFEHGCISVGGSVKAILRAKDGSDTVEATGPTEALAMCQVALLAIERGIENCNSGPSMFYRWG